MPVWVLGVANGDDVADRGELDAVVSTSAAAAGEQLLALPLMTTIEMAARALCLGRTRAYELARRNEFPCKVIRIGTSYRVVTADLHRITGIGQDELHQLRRERAR